MRTLEYILTTDTTTTANSKYSLTPDKHNTSHEGSMYFSSFYLINHFWFSTKKSQGMQEGRRKKYLKDELSIRTRLVYSRDFRIITLRISNNCD